MACTFKYKGIEYNNEQELLNALTGDNNVKNNEQTVYYSKDLTPDQFANAIIEADAHKDYIEQNFFHGIKIGAHILNVRPEIVAHYGGSVSMLQLVKDGIRTRSTQPATWVRNHGKPEVGDYWWQANKKNTNDRVLTRITAVYSNTRANYDATFEKEGWLKNEMMWNQIKAYPIAVEFEVVAMSNTDTTENTILFPKPQFDFKDYVLHSGGAIGADSAFSEIGRDYHLGTEHHYYYGTPTPLIAEWIKAGGIKSGKATELTQDQLRDGIQVAKKIFKDVFHRDWISKNKELQGRNWFQVIDSDGVFAISNILKPGEVNKDGYTNNASKQIVAGETGTAVEMGILREIPVYVYNQATLGSMEEGWYRWNKDTNEYNLLNKTPILTRNFTGIGSRQLTEAGEQAIEDLYQVTRMTTDMPAITVTKDLPALQTKFSYTPTDPSDISAEMFHHTLFETNEQQKYTFRVMADVFIRLANSAKFKKLGEIQSSDSIKSVLLTTIGNIIKNRFGSDSVYFERYAEIYDELSSSNSPVWTSFKTQLAHDHGYNITDFDDIIDDDGSVPRQYNDQAQFTKDTIGTVRSEIKDLFNTTPKIVKFTETNDINIPFKEFRELRGDTDTFLGLPDTLQWNDYATDMFKLMANANSKTEMLSLLYIAASINDAKNKPLFAIWKQLKENDNLSTIWFTQFKTAQSRVLLETLNEVNGYITHAQVISNNNTSVRDVLAAKWEEGILEAVKMHINTLEIDKSNSAYSKFINSIDSFKTTLLSGSADMVKYYADLSKLLTDIGIDLTAVELEHINNNGTQGTGRGLVQSLFVPMGYVKQSLLKIDQTNVTSKSFQLDQYSTLKSLASKIELFRIGTVGITYFGAGKELRQTVTSPNFYTNWFSKLKSVTERQQFLKELARIPSLQHSNWLWAEPNTSGIGLGLLYYEYKKINGVLTKLPLYINSNNELEALEITPDVITNPQFKLSTNDAFINSFEMFNYEGVKDLQSDNMEEYSKFDTNMRYLADIVDYFNNIDSKHNNLKHFSLKSNGDRSWTAKIAAPSIVVEDYVKGLLQGKAINLIDSEKLYTSKIFIGMKNILEQDIDEITVASKLLFGDAQGIVKLTNGKLTINPNLKYEKLFDGVHYQKVDKDGIPILLDEMGKPTGNVFKARRLQHTKLNGTVVFANTLSYFKYGAILSTARTTTHINEINKFVSDAMSDMVKDNINSFLKIKDTLLKLKRNDGSVLFASETDLRNKITEFVLNEYIANNEQSALWLGSPSEYNFSKDNYYLDFVKRAIGASAMNTQAHPWITTSDPQDHSHTTFTSLTIKDIVLKDAMLEHKAKVAFQQLQSIGDIDRLTAKERVVNYDKLLKAKPNSKVEADIEYINKLTEAERKILREIKAYYDIKISDGFSFMSYSEFKNRLNVLGLTDRYTELISKIDRIQQGSKETVSVQEYTSLIESLKEVYYHREYDEYTQMYKTKFVKDAKFVLIPGYILSKQLVELSKFMKELKIGEVQFASANKILAGQIVNITDSKGNLISLKDVATKTYINARLQTNYYKNVGLQQSIHSVELDSNNKLAVQISKIIWDNISNDEIYNIRGNTFTGTQLFENYGKLFGSQIQNSINKIITEFKGKLEYRNGKWQSSLEGKIVDENAFVNYIREELTKQGVDQNIIWALQLDNDGKTNVPISGNMHRAKILSVMEALFTNRVIRQEMPGPHSVLISNAFTSDTRSYQSDAYLNSGNVNFIQSIVDDIAAKKRTSKLETKLVTDSNGNEVLKMEVVLSPWATLFYKEGDIIDINDLSEEVRTVLGYRIPTDGKSSMMFIEVVGFLKSGSNQIYVPDEIISRAGIDFDIDTEYMMAYNLYSNKKGEIKTVPYLDATTKLNDRWNAYVKYAKRQYSDLIPDSLTDEIHAKYETLNFLISEHIPFKGSQETKSLLKQRFIIGEKLSAAKANKSSKSKIDSLYRELSALTIKISTDIDYMDYLEEVKAKGKEQVKTTKGELIATSDIVKQLNAQLDQILIDNNIIPSKQIFEQLSIEDQNTVPARQNRILDTFISVLSNPVHEFEAQSPNTYDNVQDSKDIIDDFLGETGKQFDPNNYKYKIELAKRVLQTRNLKGRVVAFKSLVSILSKMQTRIDETASIRWKLLPSELKLSYDELVKLYGDNVIKNADNSITINFTFVGNNLLNTSKNIANRYINMVLQEVQSNMFDAVKYPMSLNTNEITLNAFTMMPAFGVSHVITNINGEKTDNAFIGIDSFIHQPIISELIEEIGYRSSTAYSGNRDGKEIYDIKMKYLTKLFKAMEEKGLFADDKLGKLYGKTIADFKTQLVKSEVIHINKNNKELANKLFSSNIIDGEIVTDNFNIDEDSPLSLTELQHNLVANESIDTIKYQLSLLNTWNKLDSLRGMMFQYIQLLTQDKAKYSIATTSNNNDLIKSLAANTTLYTLVDNKATSIASAIFEHNKYPSLNAIKTQGLDVADVIITPFVLTEHPIIKGFLKDLFEYNNIRKPKVKEKISNYLTNLVLNRLPIFQSTVGEVKRRIAGISSFELNTKYDYANDLNAFEQLNLEDKIYIYKKLHPELDQPIHAMDLVNNLSIKNKDEEVIKNGYVRIEYAGTDNNDTSNSVINMWMDGKHGRLLVEDLIRYAYTMNDLTYGFNISKVLPYTVLNQYGYSKIIESSINTLNQAYNEINNNIINNNLSDFEARSAYYNQVISDIYFSDTTIKNLDHFMEKVFIKERFNKSLIPIIGKENDKEGNAILLERNGVFILNNSELNNEWGKYYKYQLNKYARFKGTANSNRLQMATRVDLFEKWSALDMGVPFNVKFNTVDQSGNNIFKTINAVNFAPGNILRINAPFSGKNKDQQFINVRVLYKDNDGVRLEKTLITPYHLESLYKRLQIGSTYTGNTFYYPIDSGLPNELGEAEIDAFKVRTSEIDYLTKVIPNIIKSGDIIVDQSTVNDMNELLSNYNDSGEFGKTVYTSTVIDGFTTTTTINPTVNIPYTYNSNEIEALQRIAQSLQQSANTTATNAKLLHDDPNLLKIFEDNIKLYAKLTLDTETINLSDLRKGLNITKSKTKSFIGNELRNQFDTINNKNKSLYDELRSIYDNNDPLYWRELMKGGDDHKRLMRVLIAIHTLQTEFEGYDAISEPFTASAILNMNEANQKLATDINKTLADIKQLAVNIKDLNILRFNILKKYVGLAINDKSTNPDVHISMEDNLLKDEIVNELNKPVSDINFFTLWLNSPAATGNTLISMYKKLINGRMAEAKIATIEAQIELEKTMLDVFPTTSKNKNGLLVFNNEKDAIARAVEFKKLLDLDHGTLIIKYKQDVHDQRRLKYEELRLIAIKYGEESSEYKTKQKELTLWLRDNYQQQYTIEYLQAKDRVDAILDSNLQAKQTVDDVRSLIQSITTGRDRSYLSQDEIEELKYQEQILHNLSNPYDGVVLKTGDAALVADTIREWEIARSEFYAKYHEPVPNPEFDIAYNNAKNTDAETFANFLEKNTISKIKQSFWDEYESLANILYGDDTNSRLSEIKKTIDTIKKQYSTVGNYPINVSNHIKQLEQERQDIINADQTERIIKFTALRAGDIFIKQFYEDLNKELIPQAPAVQKLLDAAIKRINALIIGITDENGVKHSEQLSMDQLVEMHEELRYIRDLNKRDSVDDLNGPDIITEYRTQYDFVEYERQKAIVTLNDIKNGTNLLPTWEKVFTRTVFDEEYLDKLAGFLGRADHLNKIKMNSIERNEVREYKDGMYDLNGNIDGSYWYQTLAELEEAAKTDPTLRSLTDKERNTLINTHIAQIKRIHDIENKFNIPIIYATPVAKTLNKYTKEFWDKVIALSDEAKQLPNVQEYIEKRNNIRNEINLLLIPIMNSAGIYDSTQISTTRLERLASLFDDMHELKKQYNITSTDERNAFLENGVITEDHTNEYHIARQKVEKAIEEAKDDTERELAQERYNLWLKVFGSIDYAGYYKSLETNLRSEIIKAYGIKTSELNDPENIRRVNETIADNTIALYKLNIAVRAKFTDKNGEIDMPALLDPANQLSKTTSNFDALNTFVDSNNRTIQGRGVYTVGTNGKTKNVKSIRSKANTEAYNLMQDKFITENTIYKPTTYYMAMLETLAIKHPLFKVLLKANNDYNNQLNGAFHDNQVYFDTYRNVANELLSDKRIDPELVDWFDKNHTVTNGDNIKPKGYYLKATPRTGLMETKPNSLLWSDFAPRDTKKYTDIESMGMFDIAEFKATDAYNTMLKNKIKRINALDLSNALENPQFKEWYERNHIYNPYSREWSPISIWTRLEPKDKNLITQKPNKQFFGYGKLRNGPVRTKYLDKAKTDANTKMHKISERIPSKLYYKVKDEQQRKYGINSTEYKDWYNANHILDKYSGTMKPLNIWRTTVPTSEDNYDSHVPMSHWNMSEPTAEYKNTAYETDRNGSALPTAKHLDPRYDAIKDTPLYKYAESIVSKVLDFNPNYTKETGNIPVMSSIPETWKQALAKVAGINKGASEIIEYASANDELLNFLNLPFMKKLNIKPLMMISKQGYKESAKDYENRVVNEINSKAKDEDQTFGSLAEIYAENNKRRADNIEFAKNNTLYDPFTIFNSFIEHGIEYRTKKRYERENKAYVEQIKNVKIKQETRLGNPIMARLDKRFSPYLGLLDSSSNVSQMIDFMENQLMSDSRPELSTVEKLLKIAKTYSSYHMIALNLVASVGNIAQSGVMQVMETAGGRFTNGKALLFGYSKLKKGVPDVIGNLNASGNNTKEGAVLTMLGLTDVWDESGKLTTANTQHLITKIMNGVSNTSFFGMYSTEYIVQNAMGISMLASHRIVDGKIINESDYIGDLRRSLIDLTPEQIANYEKYKEAKQVVSKEKTDVFVDYFGNWLRTDFKKSVGDSAWRKTMAIYDKLQADTKKTERTKFEMYPTVYDSIVLEDNRGKLVVDGKDMSVEFAEFREKIRQVNNMLFGNYDVNNRTKFEGSIYGEIALQFRKFIKPNYDMYYGNRFGKTQYNEFKNAYDVPAYVAWFKFVTDPIRSNNPFSKEETNVLKAMFNILHDYATFVVNAKALYNTFSPEEKAAIKKVNRQMAVMVLTMLTISLLAGLGKGDKDRDYITALAIYQTYRLYTENFAFMPFGIPGQIIQMSKSPAPVLKSMQQLATLGWKMAEYPFISEQDRIVNAGPNKGENQVMNAAKRALPGKAAFALGNIPQLINYYKMISAFEINTKADNTNN